MPFGNTNGGSQPGGVLTAADFLFTEEATGGVYTASLDVPAGSVVIEVFEYPLSQWAADSAVLDIADGTHPTLKYADAFSILALNVDYDPEDAPNLGTNYANAVEAAGGVQNTYWGSGTTGIAQRLAGWRYAADDTITITLDTTAMGNAPVSPTGQLLVKILYFAPVTVIAADFA